MRYSGAARRVTDVEQNGALIPAGDKSRDRDSPVGFDHTAGGPFSETAASDCRMGPGSSDAVCAGVLRETFGGTTLLLATRY